MSPKLTPELIDRYLKGHLSESEQAALNAQLQQDPLLSHEMKWQQDIHQALIDTRRAALKSRLDQVPVSTAYTYGSFKVATVVATLVLVAVGSWYYTQQPTTYEPFYANEQPARVDYPDAYTIEQPPVQLEGSLSKASSDAPATPSLSASPVNDAVTAIASSSRPTASRPTASKPTASRPTATQPKVVSSFVEESPGINYSDFEAPKKQALQDNDYTADNVAIEALADSEFSFHYQFYDNKLYLHGDFQKTPYKIIALNTAEDKKLFLEFDNHYYHISQRSTPTPLVAITDSTLIEDLQQLGRLR